MRQTPVNFVSDLHQPEEYKKRVRDYVSRYAMEMGATGDGNGAGDDDDDESSISECSFDGDDNMEMEM